MHSDALFTMPKVELHCHLELAFRRKTLQQWAIQRGMDVSNDADFDREFLVLEPMQDLPSVLHKFLNTRDVINTEDKVEQLTFEVCEDMHTVSNVRVLELRYAPSFLLDAHPSMDADRMLEAILRGFNAQETYPMAVGLIGLLQRIKTVEDNTRWCDWILERKEHFVDWIWRTTKWPTLPSHSPPCSKAKAQGLGITVHAGEPNVPGAPKNILVALDELGADRIGHGVQAIKDDRVVERLAREGVVLELCPTSNVLTQAVSSVGEHPIQSLMQRGVRTTINTDDPGVMGLTLMDECMALQTHLGMTLEDIHQCNEWAREASFLPTPTIQSVWTNP